MSNEQLTPREVPAITDFISDSDMTEYGQELKTGRMEPHRFDVFGGAVYDRAIAAGCTVGIIAGDVNQLKAVNDYAGHAAGDNIISVVAGAMRSEADLVLRVGGDEFEVIVVIKDKDDIYGIQGRIEALVDAYVASDDGKEIFKGINTGVALGCSVANREDNKSFAELKAEADKNLFADKFKTIEALTPEEMQKFSELFERMEKDGIDPAQFFKYLAYIAQKKSS